MKVFYKIIFFSFFIVASANQCLAQAGWVLHESGTARNLRSISTASGQHLVAVGDTGSVVTSNDKGLSWSVQKSVHWVSLYTPKSNFYGVTAISENIFCAVGFRDTIYRSTDGGVSWKGIKSAAKGNCPALRDLRLLEIQAIDFDSSTSVCVAVADLAITVFSIDSGKKWAENLPASIEHLKAVSYRNGHLLASGWKGATMNTNDVGDNWTTEWVQRNVDLLGCSITGWTSVGTNGNIYHSINNGFSWDSIPSGTQLNLNSVYFADKANGFICGDSGLILMTSDGGYTWNKQASPTTQNLRSVHFTDPFHGFICGDSGVILTTTNGGFTAAVSSTSKKTLSVAASPNPFSKRTRISFTLPEHEHIKLKIYNLLGIKVASITDENFDSGTYSFEWNSENTPSGMYICRLETLKKTVDTQIILEK
jgi:photosystem II stability/assembly factor-like uncharacterized protein